MTSSVTGGGGLNTEKRDCHALNLLLIQHEVYGPTNLWEKKKKVKVFSIL